MINKLFIFPDRNTDQQFVEITQGLQYLGLRLPTYATNAAAIADGLTAGQPYVTPSGVVMVVV